MSTSNKIAIDPHECVMVLYLRYLFMFLTGVYDEQLEFDDSVGN